MDKEEILKGKEEILKGKEEILMDTIIRTMERRKVGNYIESNRRGLYYKGRIS